MFSMESQDRREPTSRDIAKLLYERCCSPDRHVRNAAFQQLGAYLLRIAYSRLRNRADVADLAAECTQQSLVVIWQKIKEHNGPDHVEHFMSWSAGILIHKVLDELRKLGRNRTESLPTSAEDSSDGALGGHSPVANEPTPTHVGSVLPAPEQSALNTEVTRELLRLIQEHPRLSPDAKFVLVGGYLHEQDDGELAAQLRKAAVTIRVIRSRGLKILRDDDDFMAELQALATD
jgi:RNA polymerase sigma factor (sigma-70 family)